MAQDVKHVTPNANTCGPILGRDHITEGKHLLSIQLAATDKGLLDAVFLSACQSLAALLNSDEYRQRALWYKGSCIRSINSSLAQGGDALMPATIATALALASDAVS